MSGISLEIPPNSRPFTRSVRFTATYNTPSAPGQYLFSSDSKEFFKLAGNTLYYIDSYEIGGDIAESEFSANIIEQPKLILSLNPQDYQLFKYPLPIPGYSDGRYIPTFFSSTQGNDGVALIGRLTGLLSQSPSLVGKTDINLDVTTNIYEISDDDFKSEFFRRWK
jgi:hypothetical protein